MGVAALWPGSASAESGREDRSSAGFEVMRAVAIEIATAQGIEEVWEVEARRGVWKIEGADGAGVKLEVEIDGDTGDVLKMERYPAAS